MPEFSLNAFARNPKITVRSYFKDDTLVYEKPTRADIEAYIAERREEHEKEMAKLEEVARSM